MANEQSQIEHHRKLWSYTKNQLINDPRGLLIHKEDLVSPVMEEWQQVPRNFIHKMYASISRHSQAVVTQRGYPTKHLISNGFLLFRIVKMCIVKRIIVLSLI